MKNFTHGQVIGALLIAFVVISMAVVSVGAESAVPAPQAPQSIEGGPPIVLRYDPTPSDWRVPPPREFSQLRIQSATININYLAGGTQDAFGNDCYTWPSNAQNAFNYAAGIWESLIDSSVPIEIDACWTDLPSGVLGQSSPASYYRDFSGAPVANTWYAVSLALRHRRQPRKPDRFRLCGATRNLPRPGIRWLYDRIRRSGILGVELLRSARYLRSLH
jgi:hypothetical protein